MYKILLSTTLYQGGRKSNSKLLYFPSPKRLRCPLWTLLKIILLRWKIRYNPCIDIVIKSTYWYILFIVTILILTHFIMKLSFLHITIFRFEWLKTWFQVCWTSFQITLESYSPKSLCPQIPLSLIYCICHNLKVVFYELRPMWGGYLFFW